MSNAETILTVRQESTWTIEGEVIVRIICSDEGKYHIQRIEKIGFVESDLGETGESIQMQRVLPAKRVTQILDQLRELMIPAAPALEMGSDGGFTELEVGGYIGKAHYRWWSCPPQGWEGLDRLANDIFKLSETCA